MEKKEVEEIFNALDTSIEDLNTMLYNQQLMLLDLVKKFIEVKENIRDVKKILNRLSFLK